MKKWNILILGMLLLTPVLVRAEATVKISGFAQQTDEECDCEDPEGCPPGDEENT